MEEEWWRIMIFFFYSEFVLLFFMGCHDDYVEDYEGYGFTITYNTLS